MVLAIQNINFIPGSGILDQIFHQTWVTVSILGFPNKGYKITLIGLIIILIIALAANAITEKLTSRKVGGLFAAVIITLIGSAIFQAYVRLPFDFSLENIRIIAALFGAVVIAVFYTLIKGSVSGRK
ncbi:MAG TPA: hypothetical protein VKQ30_05115 [Ktedonobacterales bacterium]|nr:hypothetical protein [Ktedonobacterales bacterium]